MFMTQDDNSDPRLRWQCRRGMLELDELLQSYLDRRYACADANEQHAFRTLLTLSDQELFDYFFGALAPVDQKLSNVIEHIRRAAGA
jgi:antitoxin CptB